MKNPFQKKKMAGENAGNENQDIKAAEEKSAKKKENPLLSFLRKKLLKYRITLNVSKKNNQDGEASQSGEESPEQNSAPLPAGKTAGSSKKEKKPPKEKKPKAEKKPKEKKKKPVPKTEDANSEQKNDSEAGAEAEESKGKNKKKLLLILGGAGIAVLAGGSVAAFFIFSGPPAPAPTAEELLAEAAAHLEAEDYEKAESAYKELIGKEDELEPAQLADSYLGLADAQSSTEQADTAIITLEEGFSKTEDQRINDKLNELSPPPEDQAGKAPEQSLGEVVVFADAAFEEMLRMAMNKPAPQEIRQKELEAIRSIKFVGGTHAAVNAKLNAENSHEGYTVDGVLYTERGSVKSLEDLVHFPNLIKLVICYNSVSDLNGVQNHPKLHTLGLYYNDITDLTPVSEVSSLKCLYIYGNSITSLTPVSGLSKLSELWAQNNRITDLSPLEKLTDLRELFVGDNSIADISGIGGLTNLRYFYAPNNNITNISVVADMPSLTDFSVTGNPVTDLSPARAIANVNKPMSGLSSS